MPLQAFGTGTGIPTEVLKVAQKVLLPREPSPQPQIQFYSLFVLGIFLCVHTQRRTKGVSKPGLVPAGPDLFLRSWESKFKVSLGLKVRFSL